MVSLKVVGYTRVSTAEQAKDGVSLPAQAAKVRDFARLHDLDLIDLIEERGASGKTLDRPGLRAALARIDAGDAAGLVVPKLDRLTRSIVNLADLVERYFGGDQPRAQLLSVSDSIDTRTATGRMVLNFVAIFAQWEREIIVERTLDAMDHKRTRGETCGHPPYGWTLDADDPRRSSKKKRPIALVPHPDEVAALGLMRELHGQGWGLRAIGAELDMLGFRPRKAERWAKSSIAEILARPDPDTFPPKGEAS